MRNANKWIIATGVLIVAVATIVVYFPNYAKLRKLRQENALLQKECEKVKKEIKEYEDKLKKLKDPEIYERIARDDLGVAKEDEIVVDIGE